MSEEWISGHGPGVDLWPSVSRTPSQLYLIISARVRQGWQGIWFMFDFFKRVIPALIWGSEVTQQAGLLTLSSGPSRWQFLPACWLLSSRVDMAQSMLASKAVVQTLHCCTSGAFYYHVVVCGHWQLWQGSRWSMGKHSTGCFEENMKKCKQRKIDHISTIQISTIQSFC